MGEERGRQWQQRAKGKMIVSANQKSNQQMTEVDGWEDGDDGNEQG
jgi:hypothetical protein